MVPLREVRNFMATADLPAEDISKDILPYTDCKESPILQENYEKTSQWQCDRNSTEFQRQISDIYAVIEVEANMKSRGEEAPGRFSFLNYMHLSDEQYILTMMQYGMMEHSVHFQVCGGCTMYFSNKCSAPFLS